MICPGCDTPRVIHAGASQLGKQAECASWPRCNRCGNARKPDASDTGGSWKGIRLELGLCDICAIREEAARNYIAGNDPDLLIIEGHIFKADKTQCVPLGGADPTPGKQWRGMAGRRFDIQKLDGSEPFSCYSLWGGGSTDEWTRDRMPDNAKFLNGASTAKVGDITCFNASS